MSTGKNVHVAPNSGDMFAMVALSGSESLLKPLAVELHELAHYAVGSEHLGDGENEVGGRDALLQGAGQLEAYDLGDEHIVGLAKGDGLGLDAPDAPAEDAEAVDHGGVAVGPDERVRHRHAVLDDHTLRQVLQVDLVDDPRGRRHDREVVEGLLAPLQELVALAVALELALGVELQGRRRSEGVDLDRVVDNQVGRHERVDLPRISAHVLHRAPHRRKVDDRGHPGKVLHDDPGRQIGQAPPPTDSGQQASASTSSSETNFPPALRKRDSSITLMENGSENTSPSTFSSRVFRL